MKKNPLGASLYLFSRHIHRTLEKFIASGDDVIEYCHIPTKIKWKKKDRYNTPEEDEVQYRLCYITTVMFKTDYCMHTSA